MAPHATSPARMNGTTTNRAPAEPASTSSITDDRCSLLPEVSRDDLHDLVCVGFGPASLAIAVALNDALEARRILSGLQEDQPKVCFLEKQDHFAWHAGMQLPGAKMQISWLKDLATFRNPRSRFTFLNYLFEEGRLVQFSNIATFLPLRIEYEAYLKWCAQFFDRVVGYSQECVSVSPQMQRGSQTVESFVVTTRNLSTQRTETRRAKRVVIAAGGRPKIPPHLPQSHPRVIHSSSYAWAIPKLLTKRDGPYRVVVVGAGQSAAEIFHDLQSRYPNCCASLLIRGAALKPSDDSPFVNEVFDPERVDDIYATPPDVRAADILDDKPTNYGVVRLELLEAIYADLYEQTLRYPDPEDQQHHILPFRELAGVKDLPSQDRVRLHIENKSGAHTRDQRPMAHDSMDVDAVIVGAGYERNVHEDLLADMRDLMPGGDTNGKRWTVKRDYSVEFEKGAVADDAGIWLQGCNEATHGLSDSLLSILANRSEEVVNSMFGQRR